MDKKKSFIKFNPIFINQKLQVHEGISYDDKEDTIVFEGIEFEDISFQSNHCIDKTTNLKVENLIHRNSLSGIKFLGCIFKTKLSISGTISHNFIFETCRIEDIRFENIINRLTDTKNSEIYEFINSNTINNLTINKCDFSGKFYINDQKISSNQIEIQSLSIKESKFNGNFKLHNCRVNNIELDGVDFEKNADFFKSKFVKGKKSRTEDKENDIVFNGINVKGLTIFENCIFENKFILKYVTFEGLAQFRSAKFFKGFDLDKTNTEKEMNFYNVFGLDQERSKKETSQETYRIIKYNCERTGNIIDANKYHTLELEKRRKNLSFRCNTLEYIVFNVNLQSSNYGTNWFLTFRMIVYVGIFSFFAIYYDQLIDIHNQKIQLQFDLFYYIKKFTTKVFSFMSIVHFDELKQYPIIFFMNKVTLGYLYYQFVTAVRKDTRK